MEITAESVDGYEFLYWTKGLGADRRVVSTDKTYTVKATSGGTWLYAYYKKQNQQMFLSYSITQMVRL